MSTGFSRSLSRIGHTLINRQKCLKANLAFASTGSTAGLLSCGLITGSGTITSYVIEWRSGSRTGDVVMLSGYNPNEPVNAIHPFVDEPVQSGDLYAVVKYIVIDGTKYSPYYRYGQFSPDLKICFNYVSVGAVTCANGLQPLPYTNQFAYTNATDPAENASRSIKFNLNSDGSTHFIAWRFTGYNVVDQIIVKYYKINDLANPVILSNWAVGLNNTGDNFTSDPKRRDYTKLSFVEDLTQFSFVDGDYILFEVIPRVDEPTTTDTNWLLEIQCLDSFPDYTAPAGCRTVDPTTIGIAFDSVNCLYDITFKTLVPYVLQDHFRNYLDNRFLTSCDNLMATIPHQDFANHTFHIPVLRLMDITTGSILSSGYTCNALAGSLNVTKVGSLYTLTFTSVDDYNLYKNNYNGILADSNWQQYVNDNTNLKYYMYFMLYLRIANSCGDTYTTKSIYLHHDAAWTFDDVNYIITVNAIAITNGMTSAPCDNTYSKINSDVSNIGYAITNPDFDITTYCRTDTFLSARFHSVWDRGETYKPYALAYYVDDAALKGNIPSDWGPFWIPNYMTTYSGFQMVAGKVEITDINDPLNNFKVSTWLHEDGTYNRDPYPLYDTVPDLVYEMSGGVQIYP